MINPDFSEQWFVVYPRLHEEGGAYVQIGSPSDLREAAPASPALAVRRSATPITTSAMSRPTSADRPVPPPHLCRIWALLCHLRARGLRRRGEVLLERHAEVAQRSRSQCLGAAELHACGCVASFTTSDRACLASAVPCRTAVRTDDVSSAPTALAAALLAASIPLIARESSAAAFFAPVGDAGEMLLSASATRRGPS